MITTILVICALTVTALLVRRELLLYDNVSNPEPSQIRQLDAATWKRLSENDAILGSHEAKVKIVEFFDYECPFCREVQPTLDKIREKYPTDVAIIYRHFPLPVHSTAYSSAVAVECANRQGKFEVYHKALFGLQGISVGLDWVGLAQTVGVTDMGGYRECVEQEIPFEEINADTRLAKSLGIDAIPTLIINGKLFQGVLSVSQLEMIVQSALHENE